MAKKKADEAAATAAATPDTGRTPDPAPDVLDDDGQRYPLHDDIVRATYPDPKVAHLKGESPVVQEKRELAEQDRGESSDGANPITRLPDGTEATNAEAIAHNKAKDEQARATIDRATGADEQARIDQRRDAAQAQEPDSGPTGAKGKQA